MNEIELSNDLNQIEFEINYHKQVAGQSVWEIGRRLNHVKENNLTHGEFGDWLRNIGIEQHTANKFMKIAKEIPYSTSMSNLGYSVLHLIATLPSEQKEDELEKAERGEASTQRELQELKKQLKEKDSQLEQAQRSEQIAIKQLENEQDKEPETVEVEKVVEPDDYHELKQQNSEMQQQIKRAEERAGNFESQLQRLKEQRAEADEKSKRYDELNEAIQRMEGNLDEGQRKIAAQKEVYKLIKGAEKAIEELAPLSYLIDTENVLDNQYAQKPINKIIDDIRDIADRLERKIDENITIIEED